jgi:hypothetical protein
MHFMDITFAEGLLSLGIGVGLAAATGLRVFVPLLMLGVGARLEWLPVTVGFEWLTSTPALVAFAVATIVEIGAYYIPLIDNALDVVAGPLAVLAGIVITAAVTGDMPPMLRWALAILAGGGTAGIVQSATSIARLKSSAFTGGLGNFALATLELAGSLAASVIAIFAPVIAIIAVSGIFVIFFFASRGVFRRLRHG